VLDDVQVIFIKTDKTTRRKNKIIRASQTLYCKFTYWQHD